MIQSIHIRRRRSGAVMLFSILFLSFVVVPAVGLAVDAGVCYAVKSRLQTAADGAALSAARSLSRGVSLASQQEAAAATARKFFAANMPSGWLGVAITDPVVTFPPAPPKSTIVEVAASAAVPAYFMRILGIDSVTVNASAASTRRDVNIIMVLDRSGSLANSGSCDELREAAKQFVNQFVDGRDRVGMITFGTTYRVDFPMASDFRSRTGTTLPAMIDAIGCVGGTNSAAAYWLGYQQLVAINEPGTLNVILFFTDGKPNTLHMPALEIKSSSSCSNKSDRNGVLAPAGSQIWGIFQAAETQGPPAPNPDWRILTGTPGSSNCAWASSYSAVTSDVVALTRAGAANEVDVYGNALTGYKSVSRDGSNRITLNAANVTNAGINALVNAAANARTHSVALGLDVVTFAIGLGGTGAAEDDMMRRVANTTDSASYNSSHPAGLYIYAEDNSQLQQAFAQVASDVLRISK